jgi:hypothetical protein
MAAFWDIVADFTIHGHVVFTVPTTWGGTLAAQNGLGEPR